MLVFGTFCSVLCDYILMEMMHFLCSKVIFSSVRRNLYNISISSLSLHYRASFVSSLDKNDKKDPKFTPNASMSDSDRQLYFADYVIELQAAEDEKRRRIRDARRRAEKAQRDAYRSLLRTMAKEGSILPSTRWRTVEDVLSGHSTFGPVQVQEREAPREIFEDFVEDWNDGYRRD